MEQDNLVVSKGVEIYVPIPIDIDRIQTVWYSVSYFHNFCSEPPIIFSIILGTVLTDIKPVPTNMNRIQLDMFPYEK